MQLLPSLRKLVSKYTSCNRHSKERVPNVYNQTSFVSFGMKLKAKPKEMAGRKDKKIIILLYYSQLIPHLKVTITQEQ